MMEARSGRIINITSVVGSSGNAGQINYAASKAGHRGHDAVARAGDRSRGITRQLRCARFIDTDMTER